MMIGGLVVFILAKEISAYYRVEIPSFIYTIWIILIIGYPVGKYGRIMDNEWKRASKNKTRRLG